MFAKRGFFGLVLAVTCATAGAQENMTGSFRASATSAEVFDLGMADAVKTIIAMDEEVQWQVFVPETYDPDRPPGVFVFIDPDGWGGMPDQYRQLFTNRNMIWIGANSSERNPDLIKTVLKAMMAQRYLDQKYAIDLSRVSVGSSGVGALVALNVQLKSGEFSGAIYINGSVYWDDGLLEDYDSLVRKPQVFIIGSGDKLWNQVRRDYDNYKKDGIENVELIYRSGTIRGWPEVEQMDEALAYLDAH
jgi:hypothetical protein